MSQNQTSADNHQNKSPVNDNNRKLTNLDKVNANADTQNPKIAYTPQNILIHGKSYTINCPIGEESELKNASTYVNQFVHDIRRTSPQLNQEELLVLCCLNLYEKFREAKKSVLQQSETNQKANHLVDKLLIEAESIISKK